MTSHSARIRVSTKQDVTRPASKTATVFLHQCPRATSASEPQLTQWQPNLTFVLQKSTLRGAGHVHSVGICNAVFGRPLRCAQPRCRTAAFLELLLCQVQHFPVDTFNDAEGRVTVELDSVPVQPPRSVRNEPRND